MDWPWFLHGKLRRWERCERVSVELNYLETINHRGTTAVDDDTEKVSSLSLFVLPPHVCFCHITLACFVSRQDATFPFSSLKLCWKINISLCQLVWLIQCEIQCFLRRTQSLEDVTRQALVKPLTVSCAITARSSKQGLGISLKPDLELEATSYKTMYLNWL